MGIFSDTLKFSEVKPLYKKGNRAKLFNYRRISLPPTFSKILRKSFTKDYSYSNKNNITVIETFYFRENHLQKWQCTRTCSISSRLVKLIWIEGI
jgi:reverse gyrase